MKTSTATLLRVVDSAPPPVKVCMHVRGVARTDVRVMREAIALQEAGFAVSIVDIEKEAARPVEEDFQGIHMQHILRPGWLVPSRSRLGRSIKTTQKLLSSTFLLLRTPADIYHAHDLNALLPCYIAASVRRKPLVFDSHEMPFHELSPEKLTNRYARQVFTGLTYVFAAIVRRCAGVITVSPPIIDEMHARYHIAEVSLVRNILPYQVVPRSDRLRQHLGLSSNTRIVLYSGNLQADRTLDNLVRAARFVEPDAVIVLMGRNVGSMQAELEALVAREGLTERVKILPPVPYEELLAWIASADIGAIVYAPAGSLNAPPQLPNKFFEYVMCGLPVIASRLPAIVEMIETYDVGRIVPSVEPAALGAEINAMLTDRAGLEGMRRHALEAARRDLNWEKESQVLLRLYETLLLKRKPGRQIQSVVPHSTDEAIYAQKGEPVAYPLHS
ncbi:MAG: glycosyltransferase [Chloroflexota bacterium]|nr:glycosyltransferase [Chloroflexota bacterium]